MHQHTHRPGCSRSARFRWLALACVGCALVVGGCEQNRELSSIRAQGNEAFGEGRYDRALELYRDYSDRRPQSARARYDLGRTLMAVGEPLAASEELAIAHELEPENRDTLDLYCRALLEADRPGELATLLSRTTIESDNPADYLLAAKYLIELGSLDEAHDALLGAVRVDGGRSVEPQLALASFYRTVKDEDRELKHLRIVLYLDPGNEQASDRIRELGYVPGPSFAIEPTDSDD